MSVLCSEVFLVEWAIIIRYIDVVEEKKASLLSSTNLSSLLTFYWCDNSCGVSRCKAKGKSNPLEFLPGRDNRKS